MSTIQLHEHEATAIRIRRLGLTQAKIAKRMNRSQNSVSLALKGKRPQLLGRIVRYLDKMASERVSRK